MILLSPPGLHKISGGLPGSHFPKFCYPLIGVLVGVGLTYMDNPYASISDYKRNALKGAIHGLNPAFGLTGRFFANPIAKYAAGITYSQTAGRVVDFCLSKNKGDPSF